MQAHKELEDLVSVWQVGGSRFLCVCVFFPLPATSLCDFMLNSWFWLVIFFWKLLFDFCLTLLMNHHLPPLFPNVSLTILKWYILIISCHLCSEYILLLSISFLDLCISMNGISLTVQNIPTNHTCNFAKVLKWFKSLFC